MPDIDMTGEPVDMDGPDGICVINGEVHQWEFHLRTQRRLITSGTWRCSHINDYGEVVP